jgi:hypothetical protein
MTEILRYYLLAVLLWGAIGKARAFSDFRETLEFWLHLPATKSSLVAIGVIIVEAVLGVALLGPGTLARPALLAALILLSLFMLLIMLTLLQGRNLRCNCFGNSDGTLSWLDVLRNLTLIAAALVCLLVPPVPSPHAVAAGLGLLLALIATHSALIGRVFSR